MEVVAWRRAWSPTALLFLYERDKVDFVHVKAFLCKSIIRDFYI